MRKRMVEDAQTRAEMIDIVSPSCGSFLRALKTSGISRALL
jgi:hypothetical protein